MFLNNFIIKIIHYSYLIGCEKTSEALDRSFTSSEDYEKTARRSDYYCRH